MNLPKQKVNKLFYGKWPYKIACFLKKSSMIIRLGPEKTRLWATDHPTYKGWWDVIPAEKDQVLAFLDKVEPFLNSELQIRAEGGHFNIFCKNPTLRDQLVENLEPWITAVHGPENVSELEYILSTNGSKIIRDRLPHKQFRYKIYFNTSMPIDIRSKFLAWTSNYDSSISISGATHKWLDCKNVWTQSPFMYIKDDKTLAMFSLFLGNNIRNIEEFILRSSINTYIDQEI